MPFSYHVPGVGTCPSVGRFSIEVPGDTYSVRYGVRVGGLRFGVRVLGL